MIHTDLFSDSKHGVAKQMKYEETKSLHSDTKDKLKMIS